MLFLGLIIQNERSKLSISSLGSNIIYSHVKYDIFLIHIHIMTNLISIKKKNLESLPIESEIESYWD